MNEKPRPMNESILTKDFLIKIATEGLSIGVTTMIAFLIGFKGGDAVLASNAVVGLFYSAQQLLSEAETKITRQREHYEAAKRRLEEDFAQKKESLAEEIFESIISP